MTRGAGTRDVNLKSKDGAMQENRVYLIDITVTSEGFPGLDSSNSEGISMHTKGGLSKGSFISPPILQRICVGLMSLA